MSNVMSLKDIRNRVHRNAFDKSSKCVFSAKVGELLPVWTEEVLPGDKFKININSFSRTMPLNSAAYTRIREYFDFYFVPLRLLWRFSDNFFTQMKVNNSATSANMRSSSLVLYDTHPYFTARSIIDNYLNAVYHQSWNSGDDPIDDLGLEPDSYFLNELGYFRYGLSKKLLEYLGYSSNLYADSDQSDENEVDRMYGFDQDGDNDTVLNPFPLLAYQKIYSDFYRFSQWQDVEPWTFNIDYCNDNGEELSGYAMSPYISYSGSGTYSYHSTMFDLRYCNWDKGMFTGIMSAAQYGDTAYASPLVGSQALYDATSEVGYHFSTDNDFSYDGSGFGLSVLALRQAEFLQRWKEVSMSGNQDYKDQVEKHWGVKVPNVRSNMCQYLGGTSSSIDISEVVNNNLSDTTDYARIRGKGVGSVRDFIDFEAKEHGIIMCIYHAAPLVEFTSTGINPLNLKCEFTDYAIPELDSVGMQAVPLSQIFGAGVYNSDGDAMLIENTTEIGYAPRYYDYKTSVDRIRGVFNTELSYWVTPFNANFLYNCVQRAYQSEGTAIAYNFFKVNPAVMDSVFSTFVDSSVNTDHILVNSYFDVKVVRNLDYNGLPY